MPFLWSAQADALPALRTLSSTGQVEPKAVRLLLRKPATLEESNAFLDAYQSARGRSFDHAEREAAWAASVWIGAWKAKKATFYGDEGTVLRDLEPQVAERLRRAGA